MDGKMIYYEMYKRLKIKFLLFFGICKLVIKNKVEEDPKFGDLTLADQYKCYYCGLSHIKVEAGGMWGCPNIACSGPGNAYFRRSLKSFRDEGDKHSIDLEEWEGKVRELLPAITDPGIYKATEHSLWKLRMKILANN